MRENVNNGTKFFFFVCVCFSELSLFLSEQLEQFALSDKGKTMGRADLGSGDED